MQQRDALPVRRAASPQMIWATDTMPATEADDINLRSHLVMLYRRRKLILGVMSSVMLLGMLYTATRKPVYESVAKILVFTGQQTVTMANSELPDVRNLAAMTGSRSVDTQIEIISSPDLLESAYTKLRPYVREKGFESDTLPDWACSISQAKDADVITVRVRAYRPQAAAVLARAVATAYFEQDLELSNSATKRARIYTQQKMASAERDLDKALGQLADYKRSTGLFAPSTQLTKQAERMAELSSTIDATKAEVAARTRENAALAQRISSEQKDVLSNTTVMLNPQFSAALDRIDKLQSERATLLQEYTPGSREVREINDRIAQEESRLKQIASTVVGSKVSARNPVRDTLLTQYSSGTAQLAASTARLRALEAEAQSYREASTALPERERKLVEYEQQVSKLQRTYEMLSSKYNALIFNEQSLLPSGRLIASPNVPSSPVYPRTASNLMLFLLLSAFAGLVAAVIAENLDMRVHEPVLVEQLSGAAALSVVPEMPRESSRLLDSVDDKPVLLDSFRILRDNLTFSGLDRGMQILAVTSPGRGEGKSTTITNLAFAMAMEGTRVLLVDGDMRHPSLHKIMDVYSEPGLSSVLRGNARADEVIQPTSVENIHCIASGPVSTQAAELLKSDASREFFEDLKKRYDVILIDCPPAAGMSDAQVISTLADGVLLVVSMSHTLRPHLDSTIRTLNFAGVPIVGVVINRVDSGPASHPYYYGPQPGSEKP